MNGRGMKPGKTLLAELQEILVRALQRFRTYGAVWFEERPPSSRPSLQGEGESFSVSQKFALSFFDQIDLELFSPSD